MKDLKTLNIQNEDFIMLESYVPALAGNVISHKSQSIGIYGRGIVDSFYSQWQIIIECYQKLRKYLNEINNYPELPKQGAKLPEFLLAAYNFEIDIKHDSYLLMIAIKTYLDLFASLVDFIIFKKERLEDKIPGFPINPIKNHRASETIHEGLNLENLNWLNQVSELRHKLIHRGYVLEPKFNFKKTNKLIVTLTQGKKNYECEELEIGLFFEQFLSNMREIDRNVYECIVRNNKKMVLDSPNKYKIGDQVFNYKYPI